MSTALAPKVASRSVLVTGGAGYIGSHTCIELLQAGFAVTVVDNFCNSHPESMNRVQHITGQRLNVVQADVRDRQAMSRVLYNSRATAVIHFAGLKAVGDSARLPLDYYDNNVNGSLQLLAAMQDTGVHTLIFSSSATVYGEPDFMPYTESHPLRAMNTYGRTKLHVEQMLRDLHASAPEWRIGLLRYFNPAGAHYSGLLGEDPRGIPNNLMPYIAQVALGRRPHLNIFGNDYGTNDGTGVRDYLHVMDLAQGHVRALEVLHTSPQGQCTAVNLGTGVGYSVLDMVHTFEAASGQRIPYRFEPRRSGDLPAFWADPSLALRALGWRAVRSLHDMCADTWRWQSQNPNGLT